MEQENAQGWAMRWSRGQRPGQKGNAEVFSPEGQEQRRERMAVWNGEGRMQIVCVITRFLDTKRSRFYRGHLSKKKQIWIFLVNSNLRENLYMVAKHQ